MATSAGLADPNRDRRRRVAQVIIVSSVMFTFISYWRTAAVVLCDLASTAYYIGGIVESAIGPAAPWFILAVMLFSYAVRSVYIESSSLFVRGGVYRVVKEAMGGGLAKLSVSALMFDYILTGPTSGVSAGQYIMGLLFQAIRLISPDLHARLQLDNDAVQKSYKAWGAVVIATVITLYFFWQNLLGIHESSDKALKIMIATTIMAVIMLGWCLLTLAVKGRANDVPWQPDLAPKVEYATRIEKDPETGEDREVWIKDSATGKLLPQVEYATRIEKDPETGEDREVWIKDPATGEPVPQLDENGNPVLKPKESEALAKVGIKVQDDPLGLLGRIPFLGGVVQQLRHPPQWALVIGLLGLFIGFGHSILAMSGEETLAQVYREVESPKLPNFKRAAFIVFVYSLLLTAGISFLAVLLIPDQVRMKFFSENLIGGLARYVWGPASVKLVLEAFVVVVGFLILAGAVNTAIIGSNGVLNRVAEDGVLPDWFLRPHPRYGTTYRVLFLITALQLTVIWISRGDMILLGEAYAFGVVWSFVFKALAMVVLRFKDRTPREFKVPFNVRVGNVEVPIGLGLIFLVLLFTALLNLFTKEVATVGGITFTIVFLSIFLISEHYHEKYIHGGKHRHLEQFNQQTTEEVSVASLGLRKHYRKLVAIRSPQNLYMLEKTLAETDPDTTDVIVMTAKEVPAGESAPKTNLDDYDQQLMTAVVDRAEKAGKEVKPFILPTNNPLYAVIKTARDLQAQELVMGASNKYTADEQLEQIGFYWINVNSGQPAPLTVRLLGKGRDVHLDLGGGNRIPKISERRARSVAELRAAGVGVDRVLLVHDGHPESSDLFQAVLTMLDPQVDLTFVTTSANGLSSGNGQGLIQQDRERAKQLGRELDVETVDGDPGPAIVRLAGEGHYDLIVIALPSELPAGQTHPIDERTNYILRHAHCRVFLASTPAIPQEVAS